jgi:hypothetical protein
LKILLLQHTPVTDAGLKELASVKGLKKLVLYETKVTDAGAADLQKAMPKCAITRQYYPFPGIYSLAPIPKPS